MEKIRHVENYFKYVNGLHNTDKTYGVIKSIMEGSLLNSLKRDIKIIIDDSIVVDSKTSAYKSTVFYNALDYLVKLSEDKIVSP